MTLKEKKLSEAAKFEMPATDDYLAARCLLLNNIFVGLTLAHEAIEKLLKAIITLELTVQIPKGNKGHDLKYLSNSLLQKSVKKYSLLKGGFINKLDLHYGWRYYDNIQNRSQNRSTEDLSKLDKLWVALFDKYLKILPRNYRNRRYFHSYLFEKTIQQYTNWPQILIKNNCVLSRKLISWKRIYYSR